MKRIAVSAARPVRRAAPAIERRPGDAAARARAPLRHDPHRAADAPLRRAHRPAPARAGRAPAVGARMRAAPRGEPVHRRRRLRPAAGARPGRGAPPARLLRSRRRAARGAGARAARRRGADAAAAEQRDGADPRHVPGARRPADARASARCPPNGSTRRCWRRRCGARPRARATARSRCTTAIPPASRACARRSRPSSPTSASPPRRRRSRPPIGATHALDIVTRTLLRAGDSVLVDEPGWSVEYARLAALGMRVLPVPRGENGPDVAAMRRLIEAQPPAARPRLYVTVSVLHNPTGVSLSLQTAHRVLQLARRVRPAHRRGRHLRAPRAGARAAPGRARRARADDLRLGLLEDPDAELARRLSRRAAGAGRSPRRHQAADAR